MGELRQYHLVIGDSVQNVVILQSETKIKAALGKNVKVSLPKAFQINKTQNRSRAIKGVPIDITDEEFREFVDLNKLNYAKADRLKSEKGSYQSSNSKLMTLPKPRLLFPKTYFVM